MPASAAIFDIVDRGQPVLDDQLRSRIDGRVSHRLAMLLDRVGPQLRHLVILYAMTR